MAHGAYWASCASGSAARSGLPPGFGAAYGHFLQLVREANFAPYNLMPAFTDTFIAAWLVALLYLYHRWIGFDLTSVRKTAAGGMA